MARSNQLASLAVDIVINARRFRSTLRQTRGDLKKTADSSRGLATSITRIGLAASAFLIVQRAARLTIDVIVQTTLAFAKLEKQIIDIEKIAKINISEQFFGLARDLPSATFETISEVMAGAARAGIQGAEGIKEFSKAVIILSEVSGDIVPAEASIGIAQLLKNFDLGTDQALNLVNNIDTLSDSFVTTSGAILTSSKRLAGFASTVNISVDELNAIVTVLLATGATATTVRTTLGAIFTKIIPKSLEAGRAFGLVGDKLVDFANTVGKGGPDALKLFINELKKLPEAKAQEFLKEFGIAGSRTQIVLKLLSKTMDGEFDRALQESADSINKTSGALLKYERVAKSADAKIKDLTKQWTAFKASLGDTGVIDFVRDALRGFTKSTEGIVSPKAMKNLKDVQKELINLKTKLKRAKEEGIGLDIFAGLTQGIIAGTAIGAAGGALFGGVGALPGAVGGAIVGGIGGAVGAGAAGQAANTGAILRLTDELRRIGQIKEALLIEKEKDPIIKRAKLARAIARKEAEEVGKSFGLQVKLGAEAYNAAILRGAESVVTLNAAAAITREQIQLQDAKIIKAFTDSLPSLESAIEQQVESLNRAEKIKIEKAGELGFKTIEEQKTLRHAEIQATKRLIKEKEKEATILENQIKVGDLFFNTRFTRLAKLREKIGKAETPEELKKAKKDFDLLSDSIGNLITHNRNAVTGLFNLDQTLGILNDTLTRLKETPEDFNQVIQNINNLFETLRERAKEEDASRQAIIKERKAREELTESLKKEKEKRDNIRGVLGFGGGGDKIIKILDFMESIQVLEQRLIDLGFGASKQVGALNAMDQINDLLRLGLKNLLAPAQAKAPQFKGLTQAWKDAVTSVEKKETPFEKLVKKFNANVLAFIKTINDNARRAADALEDQEGAKIGGN